MVGDTTPKTWAKLVGAQVVGTPGTVIQLAPVNTVIPPQNAVRMSQANVAGAVSTQSANISMQQNNAACMSNCNFQ